MIVNTIKEFDLTVDGVNNLISNSLFDNLYSVESTSDIMKVTNTLFEGLDDSVIRGLLRFDDLGNFNYKHHKEYNYDRDDLQRDYNVKVGSLILHYLLGNITMVGKGTFKLERVFYDSTVVRFKLVYGRGIK